MASVVVSESASSSTAEASTEGSGNTLGSAGDGSAEHEQDSAVSTTCSQDDTSGEAGDKVDSPPVTPEDSSISSSTGAAAAAAHQKIQNNELRHTGSRRNHQSEDDDDDDDDDEDDDSNDGVVRGNGDEYPREQPISDRFGGGGRRPYDYGQFPGSICSPSGFQSGGSPVKSNPFTSGSSSAVSQSHPVQKSILRPSAFKFSAAPSLLSSSSQASSSSSSSSSTPSSSFVLRPPKLIPSTKHPTTSAAPPAQNSKAASSGGAAAPQFVPLEKDAAEGECEKGVGVPEGVSSSSSTSAASPAPRPKPSAGSEGGFVFGKNLSDRVIPVAEGEAVVTPAGVKRKIGDDDEEEADEDSSKKPNVDESVKLGEAGVVITGEEDEVNVMQLHCRLFVFDGTNSSWVERGRGLLRLNDKPVESADGKSPRSSSDTTSRLIIRTKGSLRVMLNTKVWEGMRVERAGDKSVRIMAVDLEQDGNADNAKDDTNSALRIFLIMTTSVADAFTLTSALESRVRRIAANSEAAHSKDQAS